MKTRFGIAALAAVSLIGMSTLAVAQSRGVIAPVPPIGTQNSGTVGIAPAPGGSSTTATGSGLNTSGVSEPGAPNTSRPGTIGTGAAPSGLAGDSTSAPGFPGKVGR